MRIENFVSNMKKRANGSGLVYTLNPGATEEAICEAETRLGKLPDQVRLFYSCFNGLSVVHPPLQVFPLEQLINDKNGKVPFCSIGDSALCFDTTSENVAGQWSIENYKSRYLVTLTMASFWSNKIFAWLDRQRRIWEPEVYE